MEGYRRLGNYCDAKCDDTLPVVLDNSLMSRFVVKVSEQIATFFSIGTMTKSKAPGTWGSLAALPLAFLFLHFSFFIYASLTFFILILGTYACDITERSRNSHDDSDLVIDEVVGILIAMTWLPITWQSFAFSFILFRILDIWKPFPINLLDRRIKGGLGVMLDDVAAGMIANIILQIIYSKTGWLGAQVVTL